MLNTKLKKLSILTPILLAACSSTMPTGPCNSDFECLSNQAKLDSDRDGVIDIHDAFPYDANASVDLDMDGRPDSWSNGSKSAETRKRRLDTQVKLPKSENDLAARKAAIDAVLLNLHNDKINAEFTQAKLLERINLDAKGLEKTKSLAQAGDVNGAVNALLRHYQTKFKKPSNPLKGGSLSKKEQDNFFHNHWGDDSAVFFMGHGYDWVTEPSDIREWMIQHNRELGEIQLMLSAYKKTGNKLFFDEIVARIVSYYEHAYPFTEKVGKYAYGVNHPFSNTFRGKFVAQMLEGLLHEKYMDGKTFAYLMNSLHHTLESVTDNYTRSGNHLTYELEAVLTLGLRFNELKAASEPKTGWVPDAIERTSTLLFREVFPDGMNKELSPHYHGDYSFKFAKYAKIADDNGFGESYGEEYRNLVKKAFDAAQVFQLPGFRRVAFGDAWPRDRDTRHFRTMQDEDAGHKYLATFGKEGEAFRNNKLEWGGFYALRSDWGFNPEDKAIGMVIKNGYEAEWHNQPDNLSFEMSAFGRVLVSDASQQVYSGNSDAVKAMREKYKQTRVHNTVTLDNQNSQFGAVPNRWAEDVKADGFSYDLVELENKSYDNLTHTRNVLFIDKSYYVLVDKLEGNAKQGTLRAHFQLANEDQMNMKQSFNRDHSQLESDALRLYTTLPEKGDRKGNLLIQGWQQNGLKLVSEMKGTGPYAKGAGFGVNKINTKEFERRAVAFELEKGQGTQYFVTALVPFKGDNSQGQLTPDVKVNFNQKLGKVSLSVNGKTYNVTLPTGNQYVLDTDADGENNLVDNTPFGQSGILNPYKD